MSVSQNKQNGEQPLALVHLDESVSRSVVCDGESQRVLRLGHLHLLGLTADVSEDEVFQSDLSPQKLLHVHLVRVEGAKQDLQGGQGVNWRGLSQHDIMLSFSAVICLFVC